MSRIDSWHWKISTGRHFQNGHHNTAQIQHCSISTSWINSWHRKISTGLHFQNGHHNTAKIQHCLISKVAFNLFFKPVVSGRFGRLHNRYIIIISCYHYLGWVLTWKYLKQGFWGEIFVFGWKCRPKWIKEHIWSL
jgi:hypothetical protein